MQKYFLAFLKYEFPIGTPPLSLKSFHWSILLAVATKHDQSKNY